MVRWLRWHCPPDTGFEIRALAVWGRARYLSVTEAPHNTNFHTWMGKKHFCFFQTAETGNRTPDSGVKGSGANHYPRAPAQHHNRARHNVYFFQHSPHYEHYFIHSRCRLMNSKWGNINSFVFFLTYGPLNTVVHNIILRDKKGTICCQIWCLPSRKFNRYGRGRVIMKPVSAYTKPDIT